MKLFAFLNLSTLFLLGTCVGTEFTNLDCAATQKALADGKGVMKVEDCQAKVTELETNAGKLQTEVNGLKAKPIEIKPEFNSDETSLTIPKSEKGKTFIKDSQFYKNEKLTSVTFEKDNHVESIGSMAFYGTGITSVTIPKTVKTISERSFGENKLTELKFESESELTTIGAGAFDCRDGGLIASVKIPRSVIRIEMSAFTCYTGNTNPDPGTQPPKMELTFEPESQLEYIGTRAFLNTRIHEVKIPSSVTMIGDYAFTSEPDCDLLSNTVKPIQPLHTLTFEEESKLTVIGKKAFSNTRIDTVTIPKSVTTIGESAFYWSITFKEKDLTTISNLETLIFEEPSQLTSIGKNAFSGTKITSVTIPQSVTTIGENAFQGVPCAKIKYWKDGVQETAPDGWKGCIN